MSRARRPVERERPHQAVATDPPQHAEHFPLDYPSWRAHLAAPGSHFESSQSASRRIVHFAAATRPAASTNDERRAA